MTDSSLLARLMTLGPSRRPSVIVKLLTTLVSWISLLNIPTAEFIRPPDMADRAQEPLMGGDDHDYDDATRDETTNEHEDLTSTPTLFVWLLTFSAGISGLLFGCMRLPF